MRKKKTEPVDKLIDDLAREKNRLLSFYLDSYSLGNGQYQILTHIAWDEGQSQELIAKKRNIDKSAIGKSVKRLIENGYIYKTRDENDKRAFCLFCTEKGRETVEMIGHIIFDVDQLLTKGSSQEEMDVFKNITKRMSQNIRDFLLVK